MTTEELSIKRADQVYKMLAATGFLIDAISEAESLGPHGQSLFKMNLKNTASKFKAQLVGVEQLIATNQHEDKNESIDQMADSYLLMDRLLSMCLKANRKLNPQAFEIMNNELEEVARKWGIAID